MKKIISVLLFSSMSVALMTPSAIAQSKGKASRDADVPGAVQTHYKCELGQRITVYSKPDDADNITVRWNNRNHTLTRIQTTTGANRFENKAAGLVWINIPAKSILLDSKQGRQLANGCNS